VDIRGPMMNTKLRAFSWIEWISSSVGYYSVKHHLFAIRADLASFASWFLLQ
jgi:hypothetical protein